MTKTAADTLSAVAIELARAAKHHGPFHSAHEGLAFLWEEFEELKQEVFKRNPDKAFMRNEATQVAVMAVRFIIDVLEEERQ